MLSVKLYEEKMIEVWERKLSDATWEIAEVGGVPMATVPQLEREIVALVNLQYWEDKLTKYAH